MVVHGIAILTVRVATTPPFAANAVFDLRRKLTDFEADAGMQ
jgi:hypothetical protein